VSLRTVEHAIEAQSGTSMFERDELVDALVERGFTSVRDRLTGMTQFVGGRLTG
jgi:hypothetical protein